ncbi:TetR/AcrR family transcriptional regulator [Clostridium butyricum]
MIDETKRKIVKSTLELIINRGYTLTTTKDIAQLAGVSEVTIFRKFKNKQSIIEDILNELNQFPDMDVRVLDKCKWSLHDDLKMFSDMYFKFVTKDYVKLIIGLRTPELFPLIEKYMIVIPNKFKEILKEYFSIMYKKNNISSNNFEAIVTMYMALNLGFIFLKASFENDVITLNNEEYIETSIKIFAKGI